MIKRLRVKNYALIQELDISFGENLNIVTGQTGAGKSIIIGSINLIIGDKASLEMIRSGSQEGFVEACFEIKNFHQELKNYRAALIVEIITEAILYGSPLDEGLLSSNLPFQPSSTVEIGILIDAPLSDIPYENS